MPHTKTKKATSDVAHLVFIHGISNKPEAAELLSIWRRTLAREEGGDPGVGLGTRGIKSSLVYWADVVYPAPDPDVSRYESGAVEAPYGVPANAESAMNDVGVEEQAWIDAVARNYAIDLDSPDTPVPSTGAQETLERIPLPWAIKRPFLKLFIRDTHHYLFNTSHTPRPGETFQVRDEIRARFVKTLSDAASDDGPLVVVAHSQGTIIAYDCLKNVADCPAIDCLITVGSPLGLDEVQDKLAPGYSRDDGFPEKVRGDWFNVYDPVDIVARADPRLANDYCRNGAQVVKDVRQVNDGLWTHSMTKYLPGAEMRRVVRDAFGLPHPDGV